MLGAFQPTDEEIAEETGVADEEDPEDAVAPKAAKQHNQRIILDSDDDEKDDVKPGVLKISKKKAGKQKKVESDDEDDWSKRQEPSTKMIWLLDEIKRVNEESVAFILAYTHSLN